jgi:hypothetical protein
MPLTLALFLYGAACEPLEGPGPSSALAVACTQEETDEVVDPRTLDLTPWGAHVTRCQAWPVFSRWVVFCD